MSEVSFIASKSSGETLDYSLSYDDVLQTGETINTSVWSVPAGITKESDSITDNSTNALIVVSGGTTGESYDLTNTITTTGGVLVRTICRTLRLYIGVQSDVSQVQFLVGDDDINDRLVTDTNYLWALEQSGNNVYQAAYIVCRSLAAKYARYVDTAVDSVRQVYSQRYEHFKKLAREYEVYVKQTGGGAFGAPRAGGILISEIDSVREDTDRVEPSFRRGMFRNPPERDEDSDWLASD